MKTDIEKCRDKIIKVAYEIDAATFPIETDEDEKIMDDLLVNLNCALMDYEMALGFY